MTNLKIFIRNILSIWSYGQQKRWSDPEHKNGRPWIKIFRKLLIRLEIIEEEHIIHAEASKIKKRYLQNITFWKHTLTVFINLSNSSTLASCIFQSIKLKSVKNFLLEEYIGFTKNPYHLLGWITFHFLTLNLKFLNKTYFSSEIHPHTLSCKCGFIFLLWFTQNLALKCWTNPAELLNSQKVILLQQKKIIISGQIMEQFNEDKYWNNLNTLNDSKLKIFLNLTSRIKQNFWLKVFFLGQWQLLGLMMAMRQNPVC